MELTTTMKSYVINLDRNPERLAAIGSQLAGQGIAFERIVAVDARSLPAADLAEFRRRRPGMPWDHAGQIGCFESHFRAWRAIADGPEPHAAVFEDDVHVSEDLARYLGDTSPPGRADIVRLEVSTNRILLRSGLRGTRDGEPWHGRAILPVRSTSWCAGGYVISRDAADRLCRLPVETHQPVDYMLFCLETSAVARSIRVGQVVPALCIQDKFLRTGPGPVRFASEIEVDGPDRRDGRLSRLVRHAGPAIWKTLAGFERVPFEGRDDRLARSGAAMRSRGAFLPLGAAGDRGGSAT